MTFKTNSGLASAILSAIAPLALTEAASAFTLPWTISAQSNLGSLQSQLFGSFDLSDTLEVSNVNLTVTVGGNFNETIRFTDADIVNKILTPDFLGNSFLLAQNRTGPGPFAQLGITSAPPLNNAVGSADISLYVVTGLSSPTGFTRYQSGGSGGAQAVPEPMTLAGLILGGGLLVSAKHTARQKTERT